MTAYCKNCIHLSDTASDKLKYWTCTKHVREETNFLDPDFRIWEPYEYCYKINTDGNCKDYERKNDEQR